MENNNRPKGLGFIDILQLLFIALKLTGYIHWNWVWVLSPIWVYVTLSIVISVIIVIRELRR